MNVDEIFLRIGEREAAVGWEGLRACERTFVLVMLLCYEVGNGGFEQFYFNSAGDEALVTVDALKAIGAVESAETMQQANSEFGARGPSPARSRRQAQLEGLGAEALSRLGDLDRLIYDGPEDLESLLLAFAESNRIGS